MTIPSTTLVITMVICVIVTYIIVFKPYKDSRFGNVLNIILKQALLIITLIISAVSSILVVQDRWFGYSNGLRSVDYMWWDGFVSLPLVYPRYFLFVFLLTTLSWLIVFFWQSAPSKSFSDIDLVQILEFSTVINASSTSQKKRGSWLVGSALGIAFISGIIAFATNRIPGWELILALAMYGVGWINKEYDLRKIKQFFQDNGVILLNSSIFVIALCSVLYALFGESQHVLIFYVLFVFAAINIYWHRKSLPAIFWISIASLVALTWKINGWEYVVIGDEYSFYGAIREILEHRTLWELISTTFNGNFVYGTHPYFSSFIQNFFMKMLGNHNFGWRFSNPFLVSASLCFYCYFFEFFTTKKTALTTVVLLGFTHYLLSFSKIGYNNLQAFFALGLVLGVLTWALKSRKLSSFSFLGLSIGVCFYVYPGALYILPLPIISMFVFLPPVNKDAVKRWGWAILSAILLIYPLFIQSKYWFEKIPGTFLYNQIGSSAHILSENVLTNLIYSIFSYLYIPVETHFVSTGYMDPLSSIFVVIGSAVLVRGVSIRNRSPLFLALAFLALFIPLGLTHGRPFPATTRMFLLLPWLALFVSLGLEWFIDKVSTLFSVNPKILLTSAVSAIVFVNLYNTYSVDINRSSEYHTLSSIFIKTVREINENTNIPPKSYYFVADQDWNTENMIFHQWVYLVPDSPRQLVSLYLEENQLPRNIRTVVSERDVIVIVRSTIDPKIMTLVDVQLKEWGKFMCDIKNEKGATQFQLWHSGDVGWLCE